MSGLRPKLRFPQFTGAWEEVPLKQLSTFVTERVGDGECVPYTVTSGVGLVTQDAKFGRTIAGNSLRNYIRLHKDDFAYNKSATKAFPEGYIARYRDDAKAAVPNSIFTCFRTDSEKIEAAYLDCLFASNLHGRWLRKFLTIGARAHGSLNVSDSDLMALPVPIPAGERSRAEQRKIAECLTTLDDLIAAEGRRLEALRKWKKALLQNLFPREGETTPRLRFPEFRTAGEWEEQPLDAYFSALDAGVSVNAGDRPARAGEIGVLRTSCITNGVFVPTENKVVLQEDEMKRVRQRVTADTIVITRKNTEALVGSNAYVESDYANLYLPDLLWVAKPSERADMRFIAYTLGSDAGRQSLARLARGTSGSMKGISKPDVLGLTLLAPARPEQHRIASCLGSLDTLIAEQAKKLDTLKTHKQGLMQSLFPALGGS